jgi:hypothetical protein
MYKYKYLKYKNKYLQLKGGVSEPDIMPLDNKKLDIILIDTSKSSTKSSEPYKPNIIPIDTSKYSTKKTIDTDIKSIDPNTFNTDIKSIAVNILYFDSNIDYINNIRLEGIYLLGIFNNNNILFKHGNNLFIFNKYFKYTDTFSIDNNPAVIANNPTIIATYFNDIILYYNNPRKGYLYNPSREKKELNLEDIPINNTIVGFTNEGTVLDLKNNKDTSYIFTIYNYNYQLKCIQEFNNILYNSNIIYSHINSINNYINNEIIIFYSFVPVANIYNESGKYIKTLYINLTKKFDFKTLFQQKNFDNILKYLIENRILFINTKDYLIYYTENNINIFFYITSNLEIHEINESVEDIYLISDTKIALQLYYKDRDEIDINIYNITNFTFLYTVPISKYYLINIFELSLNSIIIICTQIIILFNTMTNKNESYNVTYNEQITFAAIYNNNTNLLISLYNRTTQVNIICYIEDIINTLAKLSENELVNSELFLKHKINDEYKYFPITKVSLNYDNFIIKTKEKIDIYKKDDIYNNKCNKKSSIHFSSYYITHFDCYQGDIICLTSKLNINTYNSTTYKLRSIQNNEIYNDIFVLSSMSSALRGYKLGECIIIFENLPFFQTRIIIYNSSLVPLTGNDYNYIIHDIYIISDNILALIVNPRKLIFFYFNKKDNTLKEILNNKPDALEIVTSICKYKEYIFVFCFRDKKSFLVRFRISYDNSNITQIDEFSLIPSINEVSIVVKYAYYESSSNTLNTVFFNENYSNDNYLISNNMDKINAEITLATETKSFNLTFHSSPHHKILLPKGIYVYKFLNETSFIIMKHDNTTYIATNRGAILYTIPDIYSSLKDKIYISLQKDRYIEIYKYDDIPILDLNTKIENKIMNTSYIKFYNRFLDIGTSAFSRHNVLNMYFLYISSHESTSVIACKNPSHGPPYYLYSINKAVNLDFINFDNTTSKSISNFCIKETFILVIRDIEVTLYDYKTKLIISRFNIKPYRFPEKVVCYLISNKKCAFWYISRNIIYIYNINGTIIYIIDLPNKQNINMCINEKLCIVILPRGIIYIYDINNNYKLYICYDNDIQVDIQYFDKYNIKIKSIRFISETEILILYNSSDNINYFFKKYNINNLYYKSAATFLYFPLYPHLTTSPNITDFFIFKNLFGKKQMVLLDSATTNILTIYNVLPPDQSPDQSPDQPPDQPRPINTWLTASNLQIKSICITIDNRILAYSTNNKIYIFNKFGEMLNTINTDNTINTVNTVKTVKTSKPVNTVKTSKTVKTVNTSNQVDYKICINSDNIVFLNTALNKKIYLFHLKSYIYICIYSKVDWLLDYSTINNITLYCKLDIICLVYNTNEVKICDKYGVLALIADNISLDEGDSWMNYMIIGTHFIAENDNLYILFIGEKNNQLYNWFYKKQQYYTDFIIETKPKHLGVVVEASYKTRISINSNKFIYVYNEKFIIYIVSEQATSIPPQTQVILHQIKFTQSSLVYSSVDINYLYIIDSTNSCIYIYNLDCKLILTIKKNLIKPNSICKLSTGEFLVKNNTQSSTFFTIFNNSGIFICDLNNIFLDNLSYIKNTIDDKLIYISNTKFCILDSNIKQKKTYIDIAMYCSKMIPYITREISTKIKIQIGYIFLNNIKYYQSIYNLLLTKTNLNSLIKIKFINLENNEADDAIDVGGLTKISCGIFMDQICGISNVLKDDLPTNYETYFKTADDQYNIIFKCYHLNKSNLNKFFFEEIIKHLILFKLDQDDSEIKQLLILFKNTKSDKGIDNLKKTEMLYNICIDICINIYTYFAETILRESTLIIPDNIDTFSDIMSYIIKYLMKLL